MAIVGGVGPLASLEGQRLGRYHLTEMIGVGGMGAVYAAEDPELQRKVAVKILVRDSATARERLRREAQAMAALSHPNVVEVFDVGAWEGRIYVAMEFLVGQDLEAWTKDQLRPWREVVELYLDAARGLAAAHAEGIVHRDFKPSNVFLPEDGPVKVMDFGLAVERGTTTTDPTTRSSGSSGVRLTRTGTVMGTPAYMAPEQHLGQPASDRSDQFSFCAALFTALYGTRPFAGHSFEALVDEKLRGQLVNAERRDVPPWLHRIVVRGLSPRETDRWRDMNGLVAAVERGLTRPARRRRMAGLAGLGLLGMAGVALAMTPEERCPVEEGLDGVWDETRATTLQEAFAASSLGYAAQTGERVVAALDDYRAQWIAARRALCDARAELDTATFDLRQRCLDRRRRDLGALVDVLDDADPTVVPQAATAARSLRDVAACEAPSQLPSPDPDVADAVERVRGELARLEARSKAGDHVGAHEATLALLPDAVATGFDPVVAEAEYWVGSSALTAGAYEVGVEHLQRGFEVAEAIGYGEVASAAASELPLLLGGTLSRHEEAAKWIRHAEATLAWADAPAMDRGRLEVNAAVALRAAGKLDEALARLDKGQAYLLEAVGREHPMQAAVLNSIGSILGTRGDLDGALARFEESIRVSEAVLGSDHPSLVVGLRNVAAVHIYRQRWEPAQVLLQRGLQILEHNGKSDTADAANLLAVLGLAEHEAGRNAEAKATLERALRIRVRELGEDHGETHAVRVNLGLALMEVGEVEAAAELFARAATFDGTAPSSNLPIAPYALAGLGEAQLRQDRTAEAVATLQRAVDRIPDLELDPSYGSDTRFLLARALRKAGEPDRARTEATKAAEILAAMGDAGAEGRAEVEAFLARDAPP